MPDEMLQFIDSFLPWKKQRLALSKSSLGMREPLVASEAKTLSHAMSKEFAKKFTGYLPLDLLYEIYKMPPLLLLRGITLQSGVTLGPEAFFWKWLMENLSKPESKLQNFGDYLLETYLADTGNEIPASAWIKAGKPAF